MMEQSAVVKRALEVLRAVCATEPEHHHLSIPVSRPFYDPAGWFVNGKRVTVFPRCPRCASYALYGKNNRGLYECQSCGLQGIEETTARRVM